MQEIMVADESTKDLLEQARSGDRVAFGQIVKRYGKRLEGFVRGRIGLGLRHTLDVDDMVQETIVRALEKLDQFEWRSEDSFMRWLGGIAENLVLKRARNEKQKPTVRLAIDIPGKEPSPSKEARRDERFNRLQTALSKLPPDYRQVIQLARFEGLKIRDISLRMDRSPDAVKQLIMRALRKLKELFGDTESLSLPERSPDTDD